MRSVLDRERSPLTFHKLQDSAGLMNTEPVLDAGTDDIPGCPPDLPVVVDSVQELQSGQIQGFVETNVKVLLSVIPVRREMRDSGAEVGADGIPAFIKRN